MRRRRGRGRGGVVGVVGEVGEGVVIRGCSLRMLWILGGSRPTLTPLSSKITFWLTSPTPDHQKSLFAAPLPPSLYVCV